MLHRLNLFTLLKFVTQLFFKNSDQLFRLHTTCLKRFSINCSIILSIQGASVTATLTDQKFGKNPTFLVIYLRAPLLVFFKKERNDLWGALNTTEIEKGELTPLEKLSPRAALLRKFVFRLVRNSID